MPSFMIKCFIIVATTLDGYIGKDEKHSSMNWASRADKLRLVELTKRAGVVVMGSSTYKTIGKPLKERVNIVYSKTQTFEGAEITQDEPRVLLKKLEERGFKEVAICGGSHIYSMFMKAGVVDAVYLTIEPIIFGKGIRFLDEEMNNYRLILKDSKVSESGGSVLLEYSVDYTGTPKMTE